MTVYIVLAASLIFLIIIGVPVGFGVGISSIVGIAYFFGGFTDQRVSIMLARLAYQKMDDFLLLAIPFFLLAGRLMNTGGVTDRLFNFVSLFVRPVRGGLAHANVLGSVLFAGMSGSATADIVGPGAVELRAMVNQGYSKNFSAGITAASSLIGPIIPPSIALVAYAVVAGESVAALFTAGIAVGLLMAFVFILYVAYCARRYNFPRGTIPSLKEAWVAFRRGFLPLLTPVIILGGIYGGIFTPTEAAAVAAFYAMFLGLFVFREYGLQRLLAEVRATMIDTAVIMIIVAFTSSFGVVMIRGQVPQALANFMAHLTSNPTVLLLLFLILWLIVGCFMSQTPAILILTPILLPTAQQFGIDSVHFGLVMTTALTLGLLTPPVGMVLYALVRVSGISFEELVRICIPYIILMVGVVVIIILFPQFVLFLPKILL